MSKGHWWLYLQFTEENAARVISWLPRKLAPQVRCVLTMINDTAVHQALVTRETKPIEAVIAPLDLHSRKVRLRLSLHQLAQSVQGTGPF